MSDLRSRAHERLRARIGMPPVAFLRHTEAGKAKLEKAFADLVIYGQTALPPPDPSDWFIEKRVTFRDWAERTRAIYG